MGVFTGFTRTLSRCNCETYVSTTWGALGNGGTHLLARFGIEQYPSELNDLGRVLGDINTMLVAGCSDMYHHVSVEIRGLGAVGGHDTGVIGAGSVVSDCCLGVVAVGYTLGVRERSRKEEMCSVRSRGRRRARGGEGAGDVSGQEGELAAGDCSIDEEVREGETQAMGRFG